MAKIEKGLFAMAALLGIVSVTLLSGRSASAQGPGYFCDLTPAGTVLCNCSDNGNGTVCASNNNVRLQWCTTTATATCTSPNGKYCPNAGSAAIGNCSSFNYQVPNSPCPGNLRGNCEQPNGGGPGGS